MEENYLLESPWDMNSKCAFVRQVFLASKSAAGITPRSLASYHRLLRGVCFAFSAAQIQNAIGISGCCHVTLGSVSAGELTMMKNTPIRWRPKAE